MDSDPTKKKKQRKKRRSKDISSVLDPYKTVSKETWEKAIFGAKKEALKGGGSLKWKPKEICIKKIVPLMCMLSEDVHDNEQQRHALIDNMNQKQMAQISKFMRDFLDQKTKVPPEVIERLRRDKDHIYTLAHSKSMKKKQGALKQTGGFLPILAATALSPFVSVLAKGLLEPLTKAAVGALIPKPAHRK